MTSKVSSKVQSVVMEFLTVVKEFTGEDVKNGNIRTELGMSRLP